MSFTKTQLIHRLSHSPSSTVQAGFILSKVAEPEDKGLIMKIDQKLGDALGNVRSPISSQFCREPYLSSSLSGWIFKAVSCLQHAHFSFVTFTNDVNKTIQKKAIQALPVFLYMSLLVLAIQSVVLSALFAQSYMPLGVWFLVACITTLGGMFCFTAVVTENTLSTAKQGPNVYSG